MLTLRNVVPSQAAHYYTQESEVGNSSSIVSSVWTGIGSSELGLTGRVSKKIFKAMLWGYLPDGYKFRQRYPTNPEYSMRGAIDLCFSLPKSYSLLIGIKEDRKVRAAFREAVIDSLKLVEKEAIATRRRTARGREIIHTENIVAAIFFHNASRDNDPQYHGHGLILNMTKVNSKWYSIHNDEIFKRKKLINLFFQNALAYRCSKLGYILEKKENGYLEIAGFQSEHIDHFSSRRKKILQLVPADAPWKVRQVANLKTRQKKQVLPERQLQRIWRERARNIGLVIPRKRIALSPHIMTANDAIKMAIEHYSEKQIAISRTEIEKYILEENLGKYSQSEIDLALGEKIGDLIVLGDGRFITNEAKDTEQQTIECMKRGIDRTVPIVSQTEAKEYCNKLKATNIELTEGQRDALVTSVTSTAQILGWQGIAGSGKSFALNHFNQIAAEIGIAITGLAPTDSATENLSSSVGINCTSVAAFLKKNSREIIDENGKTAIEVVRDERGDRFEEIGADGKSRFEVDRALIVDEAGMIGAKDMRLLLEIASQLNYKVLLVGDRNQHKPISAGEPFASLQNAGMPTVTLNESIRQTSPFLKEVVKKLGNKRYGRALGQLKKNSAVVIADNPARALAAEYVALTPDQQRSTLFICSTHRQRNEATKLIRDSLKEKRILKKPKNIAILVEKRGLSDVQKSQISNLKLNDIIVCYKNLTLDRDGRRNELIRKVPYRIVGRTGEKLELENTNDDSKILIFEHELDFKKSVYNTFSVEVAEGEKLRWRTSDRSLGFIKGEEFTVEKIKNSEVVIKNIADNSTQTIASSDLKNSEYGWTITSHSAQSQTAERVFLLPGQMTNGISFYTDVARAKAEIKIAIGIAKDNDYNNLLASITRVIPENNPSSLMENDSTRINRSPLSFDSPQVEKESTQPIPVAVQSTIDSSALESIVREPNKTENASVEPSPFSVTEIESTEDETPSVSPQQQDSVPTTLFEQLNGASHIESIHREIEGVQADDYFNDKKKLVKIEGLAESIENWQALSQFKIGDLVKNKQGRVGVVGDATLNKDFVMLYVSWLDEEGKRTVSLPEIPRLLAKVSDNNAKEFSTTSRFPAKPVTKAEKNEQIHDRWDELRAIPLVEIAPLLGGIQDSIDRDKWLFGDLSTISITGQLFKDWKSPKKGNAGAIDFVMHLNNCGFNSAVKWLEDNILIAPNIIDRTTIVEPTLRQVEEKILSMPTVVEANWDLAKNYLVKQRNLPQDLVERLHKEGRIYADDRKNVVFVRRELKENDFSGEITGGLRKSTNLIEPFAMMAKGTKTDRGWFAFTTGRGELSKIVITEAAIDAMSAATVLSDRNRTMFISSGGALSPIPIDWLVEQSKKGVEINLAFDNDLAGEEGSWRRIKELGSMANFKNINRIVPQSGKDWNDLIANINLEPLDSFNKWQKFANAIGKSEKYINRVKEVVAEYKVTNKISSQAKQSFEQDYQTYQNLTNLLRRSYELNPKNSPIIEPLLDAAIAFHSIKAKPIDPEILKLFNEPIINSDKQSTYKVVNNEQRSSSQQSPRIDDSDRSQSNSSDTSTTEPTNGVDRSQASNSTDRADLSHRGEGFSTTAGLESNLDRIGGNLGGVKKRSAEHRGRKQDRPDSRRAPERNLEQSSAEHQGRKQDRSDSRRAPERNLEQSSAEHQGSNKNRRRSRQFVERNLDKFRSNLGRDRDRDRKTKRYRILKDPNSWDSVQNHLIETYNFPESLVNGLKHLDLLSSDREGNAVFRLINELGHTVGSSRWSSNERVQHQVDSVSSGYFAFANGSGDLKKVVLTSDPIEALSAATISQPETRSLFIAVGDAKNVEAVAKCLSTLNPDVDVIAAFKNDRAGEELTWTLAESVDFIQRYRVKTTWSEYVKETGKPDLEPPNWQAISQATGTKTPVENSELSSEKLNQLRISDLKQFKETQVKLYQWYEAAYKLNSLNIEPKSKEYLSNIIQVARAFNRKNPTPLPDSDISAMDSDINKIIEYIKTYREQLDKPLDAKLEELKNYDPLKDPNAIAFENYSSKLATDAGVHCAKVFAQAKEYEFWLSFNHNLKQELADSSKTLSEGLLAQIETSIERSTNLWVENTITIEELYAKYLNNRQQQFSTVGILNQWMEARKKEVSPEQFFEEYTNIKRAFNLAEKHLEATLPTNNPLEDVENYVQAVKEIALAEVLAKNRVDSEKDPLFKLRQKCISLFSNVKETFKKLLDNDPQKQQQATTTQQVPESLEKEKDVTSNREAQQPEQNSPTPDCNRTENLDNNKNSPSYNPRELEKILKYLVGKLKAQHFQGSYVFEIEVDKQKVFKGVLAESPTIDRLKPEQLETLQLAFTQPDLVKEEITISIDGQKVFQLQHGIIKCDLCGLASPQKQAEVEINPDPRGQGDNLNERVVENSNKTEVADLNQASSTQSNQHQVHKQESSTSNLAQHGVREEKSTTTPAGDDRLLAAWSKCYSNEGTSAIQKTMIAVNRALSDGESPEVVKQMILNYDPSWATEEDKEILSQRADLIIDKVYYQISQNENIDRDDPKETKHQKESHNELQRD